MPSIRLPMENPCAIEDGKEGNLERVIQNIWKERSCIKESHHCFERRPSRWSGGIALHPHPKTLLVVGFDSNRHNWDRQITVRNVHGKSEAGAPQGSLDGKSSAGFGVGRVGPYRSSSTERRLENGTM